MPLLLAVLQGVHEDDSSSAISMILKCSGIIPVEHSDYAGIPIMLMPAGLVTDTVHTYIQTYIIQVHSDTIIYLASHC